MHTVTIKPYGESLQNEGEYIEDFDDEDMDLILELYRSLANKCKKEFNVLTKVEVERDEKDLIVINYSIKKGKELEEDDLLFYMESLIGLQSENVVTFGDEEYAIKGSPQVNIVDPPASSSQERSSRNRGGDSPVSSDDFLSKIDAIALDIDMD